jgi:hypothetical protein
MAHGGRAMRLPGRSASLADAVEVEALQRLPRRLHERCMMRVGREQAALTYGHASGRGSSAVAPLLCRGSRRGDPDRCGMLHDLKKNLQSYFHYD